MPSPLLFLASALLLWLSSPGPGFSFLAWIALVPLFYGCERLSPKKAAKYGFFSGLAYYGLLIYWVVISLGTYGHLPWWLCGIALLLLSAYMALYLTVFCAAVSMCTNLISPVWIAPALWVALDFIRGKLFSGFPWQDLGYSQFSSPLLIQPASIAGHHGITFLIVICNAVVFSFFANARKKKEHSKSSSRIPIFLALLLFAGSYGYSYIQLQKNDEQGVQKASRYPVAIIQGNINQDQKWVPEKQREAIEKYIALSSKAAKSQEVDLVIWPETAMPFHPPTNPLFPELLARTVFAGNYSLLSGAPYFQNNNNKIDLYNSALLVSPAGSKSKYFKQHLVPFGEYIPLADILPLPGPVVESVGNFSTGKSSAPLSSGEARLGILICFESIFPDIARKEVSQGANMLVNITNDAWFGRSSASIQHLSMAVLRAVENRRSLARAANTGISCFIDPSGRISQPTPLFTKTAITKSLVLRGDTTFFTKFGYLFPWLCLISLIPLFFRVRK